jgi:hypothetical protein
MSLLSLVSEVADYVSLPQPASVVNSTDPNVRLLFRLCNEEGRDLASACNWQILTEEALFTTVASPTQAAAIPPDLDRFITNTFWNRSTNRPLIGPISSQKWQALQAFPNITQPVIAFRERQGQFLTFPTPPVNQTIAYEYVSKFWVFTETAPVVPIAAYASDTDTAFLDETLMALGVRWRYLKSKGLDYAEDFRTYETQKDQLIARDGGNTAIDTGNDSVRGWSQVPEGDFPG